MGLIPPETSLALVVLHPAAMTPQELRDRTKKFGKDVVELSEGLPRNARAQEIASQLVDAATGVGANYRSVCRARSRDDFINKLAIALDCADESMYWLQVLVESKIFDTTATRTHLDEAEQLTKILAASYRTACRNRARNAAGARKRPRARTIKSPSR